MTSTVAHLLAWLLVATGSGAPAPTPPPVPVAQQAPTSGVWPLQPAPPVVAGFRPPSTAYGAGHRGVDLAGRPGQVVHAAAGGRVTYAGSLAGRGVVVVDHGLTRTTYEPVTATVELGTVVAAGDPIGRLERSGSHCAPAACLHWGLLEAETYLDPLTLVGAGPVRLLPLDGLGAAGRARQAPGSTHHPPGGAPGLAGAVAPAALARLHRLLERRAVDDPVPRAAPAGQRPV